MEKETVLRAGKVGAKMIREVIRRISETADPSTFEVLEAFAREGKWQIAAYADQVRHMTAWEYMSRFEQGLRETLPEGSDVKICDSFEEIRTTDKRFDMVVFEGPILCKGTDGPRIEHFDMFPHVFRTLKDCAFLVPEVYTSPNKYRRRHNREKVPAEVLAARKAFYRVEGDGDFIPIYKMIGRYGELALENGFKPVRWFYVRRSAGSEMVYICLELEKIGSSMVKIDDGTDYFEFLGRINGERIMFADQVGMDAATIDRRAYAIRHDIDRLIENGIKIAEREHQRGIRSTFFLLHTAPYWDGSEAFKNQVRDLARMGHHIALHHDGLGAWAEAHAKGFRGIDLPDPRDVLIRAMDFLRKDCGVEVRGIGGHGNRLAKLYRFNNYHVFSDWKLPSKDGAPDPELMVVKHGIKRFPLSELGVEYEVYHLPRHVAIADSGGKWRAGAKKKCPIADSWDWSNFTTTEERIACREAALALFNNLDAGILHLLIHPNWWKYG